MTTHDWNPVEERGALGLTLQQLAARIGVAPDLLSAFEHDPDTAPEVFRRHWAASVVAPPIDAGAPLDPLFGALDALYAALDAERRAMAVDLWRWRRPPVLSIHSRAGDAQDVAAKLLGRPVSAGLSHLLVLHRRFGPDANDDPEVSYSLPPGGFSELTELLMRSALQQDQQAHQKLDLLRRPVAPSHQVRVIFAEAPLLQSVALGVDSGSSSRKMPNGVEALLLCSPIVGFLDQQDISDLGEAMRLVPVCTNLVSLADRLCNIHVVATHAAPVARVEIERVLGVAADRAWQRLEGAAQARLPRGASLWPQQFRSRLFAFDPGRPTRYMPLLNDLQTLLRRRLPDHWVERAQADARRLERLLSVSPDARTALRQIAAIGDPFAAPRSSSPPMSVAARAIGMLRAKTGEPDVVYTPPPPQSLQEMREDAGLSLPELAQALNSMPGIREPQTAESLARYEADPESAPGWLLKAWPIACGYGVPMQGVEAGDPYGPLIAMRESLFDDMLSWSEKDFVSADARAGCDKRALISAIGSTLRVPRIMAAGKFDSGKTYIIRHLLGQEGLENVLISQSQPMGRVIVVLMHVDHRPRELKNPVALMSEGFDLNRLHDPAHFTAELLLQGDLSLISRYAVHQPVNGSAGGTQSSPRQSAGMVVRMARSVGDATRKLLPERARREIEEAEKADLRDPANAKYCLVFLDKPLLRAAHFLDAPGTSSGVQGDTLKASNPGSELDVLLYMARFVGMMDALDFADLNGLMSLLRRLDSGRDAIGPFDNLFVVASHVQQQAQAEMARVFDVAAQRTWTSEATALRDRAESKSHGTTGQAAFASRFFCFDATQPPKYRPLVKDLQRLLTGLMPTARSREARTSTEATLKRAHTYFDERVAYLENWLSGNDKRRDELKEALQRQQQLEIAIRRCEPKADFALARMRADGISEATLLSARFTDKAKVLAFLEANFQEYDAAKDGAGSLIESTIKSGMDRAMTPGREEFVRAVHELHEEASAIEQSATHTGLHSVAQTGADVVHGRGFRFGAGTAAGTAYLAFVGKVAISGAFLGPIGIAVAAAFGAVVGVLFHFGSRWGALADGIATHLRDVHLAQVLLSAVNDVASNLRSALDADIELMRLARAEEVAECRARLAQSEDRARRDRQHELELAKRNRDRLQALVTKASAPPHSNAA